MLLHWSSLSIAFGLSLPLWPISRYLLKSRMKLQCLTPVWALLCSDEASRGVVRSNYLPVVKGSRIWQRDCFTYLVLKPTWLQRGLPEVFLEALSGITFSLHLGILLNVTNRIGFPPKQSSKSLLFLSLTHWCSPPVICFRGKPGSHIGPAWQIHLALLQRSARSDKSLSSAKDAVREDKAFLSWTQ